MGFVAENPAPLPLSLRSRGPAPTLGRISQSRSDAPPFILRLEILQRLQDAKTKLLKGMPGLLGLSVSLSRLGVTTVSLTSVQLMMRQHVRLRVWRLTLRL